MVEDFATCSEISRIDDDSSSVATATVCTLAEVCSAALATLTELTSCDLLSRFRHDLSCRFHFGSSRGEALRQSRDVSFKTLG